MEKTYKIVPFDIELAKKIQAGEIKGKIKTKNGNNVRVTCWDVLDSNYVILALITTRDHEIYASYTNGGFIYKDAENTLDLVLEVPDNEPQFKPFDKVLVRDRDDEEWETSYFSHIKIICDRRYYIAGNIRWKQCIAYEGNEHLIGTTNKPKED